jgi:hypothetical protein
MAFIDSTCLVIWPPTSSATSRSPWDPFFGDGTRRVLDSDVSRAWTISDAGLGAVSYMLEALSGLMGGKNRWRTMPWMVPMFGVLGVVSVMIEERFGGWNRFLL